MDPRGVCLEVAEQTLSLPNPDAWTAMFVDFRARGFKGRRLRQMRDMAWEERKRLKLTKKPPEPDVFQPTRCGPVIDGLLQGLEKSVTRA